MRVKVTLRCNECKQRNYNTMKNKKNDPDRLEMNKYCRFCQKAHAFTAKPSKERKGACNNGRNQGEKPGLFRIGKWFRELKSE